MKRVSINLVSKQECFLKDGCLVIENHRMRICIYENGTQSLLSDRIVNTDSYKLIKASAEEIKKVRRNNPSIFVMRSKGILSYTCIPKDLSLLSTHMLGDYVCVNGSRVCKYFSFGSPSDGGCFRVAHARHIEDMPEIEEGYETFGTIEDAWPVAKCSRCAYVEYKDE